eukprot:1369029-Pleurochrysis_carterae.AAC.1
MVLAGQRQEAQNVAAPHAHTRARLKHIAATRSYCTHTAQTTNKRHPIASPSMVALAVSLASAAAAFSAHGVWQQQHYQQVHMAPGLKAAARPRVASTTIQAKVEEKEPTVAFPDFSSLGDAVTGKDRESKNNKPDSPPPA